MQNESLDEAVASPGRGRVSALHLETDALPILGPLVVMRPRDSNPKWLFGISTGVPHLEKKFAHRLAAYQSVFELLVATAVNVRLALASGHGGSIGPCPLWANSRSRGITRSPRRRRRGWSGQRYAKVASDSHVGGQLEAGRLYYRQIGGLSAAGDRVDVVNPAVSRVVS